MTPLFRQKPLDDRAFERLYRVHVQDVYRYALMVLRNPTDAEDVTQTTFMKAYRAFQRGEELRHPRRWLITIAHNTCRTRLRDAKRRPQEVELEEQLAPATNGASEDGIAAEELVHALGALSFNQRSALVMRELEGRSYAEIAAALDVSTSAVETVLFRARRALREQLEGPLGCGEAERALSLQLDGRLDRDAQGRLRAHLRECRECASLARRERARRAALRSIGPLPLPASLASWGGGGSVGAGIGAGLAAKAAAVVVAGVAAVGTASQTAEGLPQRQARIAAPAAAVAERAHARTAKLVPKRDVSVERAQPNRDRHARTEARHAKGPRARHAPRTKLESHETASASASPRSTAPAPAPAATPAAERTESTSPPPPAKTASPVPVAVPEVSVPVNVPVQVPTPPPLPPVPQVPSVEVPPLPVTPPSPAPVPVPSLP